MTFENYNQKAYNIKRIKHQFYYVFYLIFINNYI